MKRKTCASVLALVLTCAMITGSLPVRANAAETAAASELETNEAGDETVGEQEQVTEPVQEEVKQEEQTTEPGQEEVKQEEQTTESVQEVKKQEEQVTESAPKEETQEEQITEPTADQAAQEEQAAPVAAEAADSVKYLASIPVSVYETEYWFNETDHELRDPLRVEPCGENEYNLYLYDVMGIAPFALANLAEDAPEDTVVTASWYHLFMEEQNSEKLTSDNRKQLSGIMTVSDGTLKTSDITVTASSETTGKSQTVTIHIVTVPCLEGLSIVDGSGEKVAVDNEVDGLVGLAGLEVAEDHVELI